MAPTGEQIAPVERDNHQAQDEHDDQEKEKKRLSPAVRVIRRSTGILASVLAMSLDVFDLVIKILGPIFVMLALGLFSFMTYTYFIFVLPSLGEDMHISVQVSVTMLGVSLLANLFYNYIKAICTDPGTPPEWDSQSLLEDGVEDVADGETASKTSAKKCHKCNRQKPVRAHHCSVCKKCVMKMDHHCPWINNCVGFHNYRYFMLFLMYLALSCLFVMVTFFDGFLDTMQNPRHSKLSFGARQCVSLCWIIATCILFALCLLGGFHVYLVLTNQTTIEYHTNMHYKDKARRKGEFFRNPYDLGRARNFKQVFGPSEFWSFRWALSCLAQPPIGDGMTYQSSHFTKA